VPSSACRKATTAIDIDRIVDQEQAWLAAQENATLNDLTRLYQDTLLDIHSQLASLPNDTMTYRHLQAIEAQLDVLISEMHNSQQTRLEKDLQATYKESLYRERNTWIRLEEFFQQPKVAEQFRNFLPVVPQQAIKALVQVASIPMARFSEAVASDVRSSLAKSLLLGEGAHSAARRLEREGFDSDRGYLQLVARMELSRAQNTAKANLIEQVNKKHSELDLWQMVRDRIDRSAKTRNFWLSWAINNTVRNVSEGEYFECHWPTIRQTQQEWRQITGKKVSELAVVWEKFSEGYRGMAVPAHFNDRAVLLPWRPAWGIEHIGPVKHPQGPIGAPQPIPIEAPPTPQESAKTQPEKKPKPRKEKTPTSMRGLPGPEVRAQLETYRDKYRAFTDLVDRQYEIMDTFKSAPKPEQYNLAKEYKVLETDIPKELAKLRKEILPQLHAKVPGKVKMGRVVGNRSDAYRKKIEKGISEFNSLIGPGLMDGEEINFHYSSGARAGYIHSMRMIQTNGRPDPATLIHEMGHWLENSIPEFLKASADLWRRRTAKDDFRSLADLYANGQGAKMRSEYAKRDAWIEPYMGKVYFKSNGRLTNQPVHLNDPIDSTELISMGLEMMWLHPLRLAYQDPELFDLLWGLINGIY
jgi:hypothetical protein